MKKLIIIFLFFISIIVFCAPVFAQTPKDIRIGVVFDNISPFNRETYEHFKKEFKELYSEEYNLIINKRALINGKWDKSTIHNGIEELLEDDNIDIVLTAGYYASTYIINKKKVDKPVIAMDIPKLILINKKIPENVNTVKYEVFAGEDIETIKEITPFRQMVYLANDHYLKDLGYKKLIMDKISKIRAYITIIPLVNNCTNVMSCVNRNTDLLVLGNINNIDKSTLNCILKCATMNQIPVVSLFNELKTDQQLLASATEEDLDIKYGRLIAINLHSILSGHKPSQLLTETDKKDEFVLNLRVARNLKYTPAWKFLIESDFINAEDKTITRILTMKDVVNAVLIANLEVLSRRFFVAASEKNIGKAFSAFLPRVDVFARAVRTQGDRNPSNFTLFQGTTVSKGIFARQLLFSDERIGEYLIEKYKYKGDVYDLQALELDIAALAATAYLNVLKYENDLQISIETLKLSKRNLEFAISREQAGASDASDVYRWQSNIAKRKGNALKANATYESANVELNRIMNRPLEEKFRLKKLELKTALKGHLTEDVIKYFSNPWVLDLFREFLVKKALKNAPELKKFDKKIKVKIRELKTLKREFYLPIVNFRSVFSSEGSKGESVNFYRLQIDGDISVLDGGDKIYSIQKANRELEDLKFQKKNTALKIAQRTRNAVFRIMASYPNIEFTKEAFDSAKENLELVSDAYLNGTRHIIELIDAQNNFFVSKERSENAFYNFLIDVIELKRALSDMSLESSYNKKQRFVQEFYSYLKAKKVNKKIVDNFDYYFIKKNKQQ